MCMYVPGKLVIEPAMNYIYYMFHVAWYICSLQQLNFEPTCHNGVAVYDSFHQS